MNNLIKIPRHQRVKRRAKVVNSWWDEKDRVGWMRFKCDSCGHEYSEKSVHRNGPKFMIGKPFSRFIFEKFAKYWSDTVIIVCPKCSPKFRER